jgi:hypothetical protein
MSLLPPDTVVVGHAFAVSAGFSGSGSMVHATDHQRHVCW